MADMMQVDLVSPERRLASLQASEVQLPGAEGDLTAMANHAPPIPTMRPGILRIVGPSGAEDYAVTGGFAEITPSGTTVLAERAMPLAEAAGAGRDGLIADAKSEAEAAEGPAKDTAMKLLSDLEALKAAAS